MACPSSNQHSTTSTANRAEAVVGFVAEHSGTPAHKLAESTTLFGDLGVDGDDAKELIWAFAEAFGVNLTGFQLSGHFGSEGLPLSWPIAWLRYSLHRGTPEERASLEPTTIGDLIRAANVGRWEPCA